MPKISITSVRFGNFKALGNFTVSLQEMNILVGPNNSGKSTIIGAFRMLDVAVRKARSRSAELVSGPRGREWGYPVTQEALSVSIENVHTDYAEVDSYATFNLSNGNQLILFFSEEGGCNLVTRTSGRRVVKPSEFKRAFPITLSVIPILGPVEHNERVLAETTVVRGLSTNRSSRHFRNFWFYHPDGFDDFRESVRRTWPGMDIQLPERISTASDIVVMFCLEHGISRELYWAGFGFQIWCQLLTQISRSSEDTLIVVDEPEIYLHPDVQRQLLGILGSAGPDVVLATHSTEIMGEADPTDILLIDKTKSSSNRLKNIESVQLAYEAIGSVQNIALTQLARTRRLLYFEDLKDYKIVRRFARRLGKRELSSGIDLTAIKSGGFSSWQRVLALAQGVEYALGVALHIGVVYDRDYLPEEQIDELQEKLSKHLGLVHFHTRKEIENYLLVPKVLERTFLQSVHERENRTGKSVSISESVSEILDRLTDELRGDVQAQYIARRLDYFKGSGLDISSIASEAITQFDRKWDDLNVRLQLVPGKVVLALLRRELQEIYAVNLTDVRIVDSFRVEEIPDDMKSLVKSLDTFRTEQIYD